MGQCKLCNKKGLFLKLNKGYCNECFNKIVFYQKNLRECLYNLVKL